MSIYEVPQPLLNSPFEQPKEHWNILKRKIERLPGRRRSLYYYRDAKKLPSRHSRSQAGIGIGMMTVNLIRQRLSQWRLADYVGITTTTRELIEWWRRAERNERLFFAQLEAAETIIFLTEAPMTFRQGISIGRDEPSEASLPSEGSEASEEDKRLGRCFLRGFLRYACKMAPGTGKSTVMGMLAAWSILNKVTHNSLDWASDTVLIVCPSVTIREQLRALDPNQAALTQTSLYETRDLVPPHLMSKLSQGQVIVTTFEQAATKVSQSESGQNILVMNAYAHHAVRMTCGDSNEKEEKGSLAIDPSREGFSRGQPPESVRRRYFRASNFADQEEADAFCQQAAVWMDGLDRIHQLLGINVCVDFSATPYFLGGTRAINRPFGWLVSDFGLAEAIESGLVKVPQVVQRAPSISPLFPYQLPWNVYDEELIKRDLQSWPETVVPGKSNLWQWLLPFLAYYDYRPDGPKAESILKYAYISLTMLGKLWEKDTKAWAQGANCFGQNKKHAPILLIVCQNSVLAQVVYKWLAASPDKPPFGVPRSMLRRLRNDNQQLNTLWLDPALINEINKSANGGASDASCWLRFTYQTIGQKEWPTNPCPEARGNSGEPIYPTGFEALANKLGKPLSPPGRDVGCVIVAGRLPEGWHLPITHLIGLRSFTSQLQCELVVGPALRTLNDHAHHQGQPEVLKMVGIPFEIVPFNASS